MNSSPIVSVPEPLKLGEVNTRPPAPRASATPTAGKSFGIRAGAYIIDFIVFTLTVYSLSFLNGILLAIEVMFLEERSWISSNPFVTGEFSEPGRLTNLLFGFVLMVLYFAPFEWIYGATPGKILLKMRVVREDGEPCGLGGALVRGVLRVIDGLLFGLPAYLSMKWPVYQRIGDKAAHTVVVAADDPAIHKPRPWWRFLVAAAVYLAVSGLAVFVFVTLTLFYALP